MSFGQQIAEKDFPRKVLGALRRQGIRLHSTTWLPGQDGSYANGERGYQLDDNGTSRIRSYAEVMALGGQPLGC